MSAKIEEIVEVLEEIRDQFRTPGNTLNIYTLRRRAIITIAARREITVQSVNDKFIRKIRPDINYLPDFDKLIQDWLIHGSTSLQNILSKHATSQHDRELIKNAFYLAPEPDLLLAEEFGLDPNEESFKEGKEKFRLHCTKERNRHLVILAKSLWFRTSGRKNKMQRLWVFVPRFLWRNWKRVHPGSPQSPDLFACLRYDREDCGLSSSLLELSQHPPPTSSLVGNRRFAKDNNRSTRSLLANQSLKLTEPAVDDFAARCWTDLGAAIGTSAQRVTWRRLFAPQLSSGPLGR